MKPDKTGKNRDSKGKFTKGKSGNPGGRPKGTGLNLTSLLKVKLEEIPKGKQSSYKELFVEKLLHKGLVDGDLQSLKLIMNYVDGLPKQSLGLSTDGEGLKINITNYGENKSSV